jgi:hypothetical protein
MPPPRWIPEMTRDQRPEVNQAWQGKAAKLSDEWGPPHKAVVGGWIRIGRVDDDLAGPIGSPSSELFHGDERDRQKHGISCERVLQCPGGDRAAQRRHERPDRVRTTRVGDRNRDAGSGEQTSKDRADVAGCDDGVIRDDS